METHIIKKTLENEYELKISNKILNIRNYMFFFDPLILQPENTTIANNETPQQKQNNNPNKHYFVKKHKRNLSKYLPANKKTEIKHYLTESINILINNNLYVPLINQNIQYDTINKIPLITDFKKTQVLTKWNNKEQFKEKNILELEDLLFYSNHQSI